MEFRRLPNVVARWRLPASEHSRRLLPILLTAVIGLGLTLGLFVAMRCIEQSEKQAEFDYASQHYVEAVRRATEGIKLIHEFMGQDHCGSAEVSRKEFSSLCEPILAHTPSLRVLQWAPRVGPKSLVAFEQRARRDGWPDYRVVELDPQGKLARAQPRIDHFPILYAASQSDFEATYGWDFAADPVLRKVIAKCRDTGRFVVSDRTDLSNAPRALQTFLPVYWNSRTVQTVADRRANLRGLLVGLIQVDELVERAVNYASGPRGIDLALFDESAPADRRLLYFHASRTRTNRDGESVRRAERRPAGIHHTEEIDFGGRRWSVVCTPTPHFFAAHLSWRSWAILTVGLAVTYLSYILATITQRERVEQFVRERTLELRKKDDQIRRTQEAKTKALRAAHEETIQRLVTASLCRDEETGMHIKRTGLVSEYLARVAGWSHNDAEILRMAAPMHDVGKIGIPDAILQKPGKLTPGEFETMKMHALIGAKMLEGSQSEILAMAHDVAQCHHERWDGFGYPQGLSGQSIPESARIVSIVDVYDALSHDRVYRPAFAEEKVLQMLAEGAGTQFDPMLVAVFLAHYEAIRLIAEENPDETAAPPLALGLPAPAAVLEPAM